MSDHLPECPLNNIDIHGLCMCPELRACEQRVTDHVNREWAEISVDDEVRIWNEALDAAREAVEEWLTYIGYEYLLREGRAAIDALREEKK